MTQPHFFYLRIALVSLSFQIAIIFWGREREEATPHPINFYIKLPYINSNAYKTSLGFFLTMLPCFKKTFPPLKSTRNMHPSEWMDKQYK